MPINFFDTTCKTNSNKSSFGLCDNPDPAKDPAFIDEIDITKWIAEVKNEEETTIDFYAIDNCVEILKPNGYKESRCDGLLHYNNTLTFVELKDRASSGWVKKGREQLIATITHFSQNTTLSNFQFSDCYVCNKQRPLAVKSINTEVQQFKNDTAILLGNKGLLLKADRTIVI
jgi:hypothetical protein